jgi:plastocyanin
VVRIVRKLHLFLASVLIMLLGACGSSSTTKPQQAEAPPANLGATVTLKNIVFIPTTVTIRAGQAVWWKWDDGSVPHNVTADTFQSLTQEHGSYARTFDAAGTFQYKCTIHSGMTGKVIVTP